MGDIVKICGRLEMEEPEGWNPEKGQFNLPFTIELKENFHIHWQDIRIEMMPDDFEKFYQAITEAYKRWTNDGKPKELKTMKRYGWWPGENDYDFYNDRDKKYTKTNELCHHFKKFPRTERGELFFDSVFQIELQKAGQYHIHYKNFRLELGRKRLNQLTQTMLEAVRD